MYPVILNLQGRLAVVVGGGPVGRRKAAAVRGAGARVRLVCREERPPDAPPEVEWRTEEYRPGHLDGAHLVFAAAPAEVNRRVVADARARGLWVNSATEPAAGDFLVPAVARRGGVTLAVATGGGSPALARVVRDRLAARLDEAFGQLADLLAEVRPLLLAAVPDPGRRRAVLQKWCGPGWLRRLRREGPDAVRRALLAEVQKLAGPGNHAV